MLHSNFESHPHENNPKVIQQLNYINRLNTQIMCAIREGKSENEIFQYFYSINEHRNTILKLRQEEERRKQLYQQ